MTGRATTMAALRDAAVRYHDAPFEARWALLAERAQALHEPAEHLVHVREMGHDGAVTEVFVRLVNADVALVSAAAPGWWSAFRFWLRDPATGGWAATDVADGDTDAERLGLAGVKPSTAQCFWRLEKGAWVAHPDEPSDDEHDEYDDYDD